MNATWTSLAIAAAIAGCATPSQVPGGRFVNAPPVLAVNDRQNVGKQPQERKFLENLYHYDALIGSPIDRKLDLRHSSRARGVNALDEVPNSTWFTNRIGVRDLTIEELVRGPLTIESPEKHKPWTIKSTKVGGAQVGFVIEDKRGEKFLLKFDSRGFPEQETATNVIVGHLLWACGFNVPEDFIVDLNRQDLVLAKDATVGDQFGGKRPLTAPDLDRLLERVEIAEGGRIRAYASRWLDGKPLGGHPADGTRRDDPNDHIAHEERRDLRGSYAMFAWLDHVDVQESNYLDMYVKDPADPKRHYVKHYLLDFGKSLGVMATTGQDPRRGTAYVVDWGDMGRSLITAGMLERTWETKKSPKLRGIGLFEAETFDPAAWKPDYPAYTPFLYADRFDKFWGAKILMRFTREQIHAVVESSRLSDPRAVEYLTDTLVARQLATAAHWFSRVNPLDRFHVDGGQLCFDDLSVVYGFAKARTTGYRAVRFDRSERAVGTATTRPDEHGRACVPATLAAGGEGDPRGDDGYTIVRITTTRPGFEGSTLVHLARDPASGAARLIGIWRL